VSTKPTSAARPRCQWIEGLNRPCGYRLRKGSTALYCGPHLALYQASVAVFARSKSATRAR
jgi:hypothetical protein